MYIKSCFVHLLHAFTLVMYSQITTTRSKVDVTATAAHICSSISPSFMWGSAMVSCF